MANIWVISDTHFSHANFLKFTDKEGKLIRPFKSIDEMDELMIENWNKTVKDGDKVYHLGDVYFGSQKRANDILYRLKGQKRLIVGNHDCIYGKGNPLQVFFRKIYMWRMFPEFGLVLSHVPVHEDSLKSRKRGQLKNVHGHTHEKGSPAGPYQSVCVELIDYTPVNIEELRVN